MADSSSQPLRAFIFDLDGVLVETEGMHHRAWARVIESHGGSLTHAQFSRFVGCTNRDVAEWAVREFGLGVKAARLEAEKRALVRREWPSKLKTRAGARVFLRRAHGRVRTGVASNSNPDYVRMALASAGLGRLVDAWAGREDGLRPKPAPDIFRRAAQRLRVPPRACLAFEDSGTGVRAARAAGMRVVAVANAYSRVHDFEGAELVVQDWRAPALQGLLEGLRMR